LVPSLVATKHLRRTQSASRTVTTTQRGIWSYSTSIGHKQIAATDRQIDQLVYDLYGLTDAEIQIVEEGTAK
jgi:hypothetical protein